MKNIYVFILTICACTSQVVDDDIKPISVNILDVPSECSKAVVSATEFWSPYLVTSNDGIGFVIGEPREVKVENNHSGRWDPESRTIYLGNNVCSSGNADMLVSHELGHVLGLTHRNEEGALMAHVVDGWEVMPFEWSIVNFTMKL